MPEGGEILAMTSLPTEGHGFNRDARSHFGDDRRAPPPEGARMGLIESSHRLIDPFFGFGQHQFASIASNFGHGQKPVRPVNIPDSDRI